MKVIFMGTPRFAEVCLNALACSRHELTCVVCQPDRKGNRNKMTECEVAFAAKQLGLPVLKAERIGDKIDELAKMNADIIVTAAYGQMLSCEILNLTPFGVVNVHASLLPHLRGASPIQSAIISGKRETGVTIMKTVLEMDKGDVVLSERVAIDNTITADELSQILAQKGAALLVKALDILESGQAVYIPQNRILNKNGNRMRPSYCKKLKANDEIIDWSMSSEAVSRHIRGLSSNPGARTVLNGVVLKIYRAVNMGVASAKERKCKVGQVVAIDKKAIFVKCGRGIVRIDELQLAGGKRMNSNDFINGGKIRLGDILGEATV